MNDKNKANKTEPSKKPDKSIIPLFESSVSNDCRGHRYRAVSRLDGETIAELGKKEVDSNPL